MNSADFLIVGGGIIGTSIALGLAERELKNILVIEKEDLSGRHASGRNSGVLHAGLYYAPDSLKAKFCAEGNKIFRKYCEERGLKINSYGKVVVCKNHSEIETLYELEKRGKANGVDIKIIDKKELKEIEPYAYTYKKALFSPNTAVVDPKQVLESLIKDVKGHGVKFMYNSKLLDIKNDNAITSKGKIRFKHLINCAGLYADRLAHKFGVGLDYTILPFKGIYKKLRKEKGFFVKSNIYPVPNLKNPFLGVHFTRTVYGDVIVGPTAIPAFGRENYKKFDGLDVKEFFSIFTREMHLFIKNKANFRDIAIDEMRKYVDYVFYKEAKKLVPLLSYRDIRESNNVGIRAQLLDTKTGKLIMDFLVINGERSTHILNAVSPAFTSSIPFSRYVVENHIIPKYTV